MVSLSSVVQKVVPCRWDLCVGCVLGTFDGPAGAGQVLETPGALACRLARLRAGRPGACGARVLSSLCAPGVRRGSGRPAGGPGAPGALPAAHPGGGGPQGSWPPPCGLSPSFAVRKLSVQPSASVSSEHSLNRCAPPPPALGRGQVQRPPMLPPSEASRLFLFQFLSSPLPFAPLPVLF